VRTKRISVKTMKLGEIFTEEQLKQAAKIMDIGTGQMHKNLVSMLEHDPNRFNQLQIDIGYAAYLLEYHRSGIVSEFGTDL